MSDSGKKKASTMPPELADLDWDKALAEWEESTFVPEVARDLDTKKPAQLTAPASRTLYRPPTPLPNTSLPPLPASDDSDSETVVGTIPREILDSPDKRKSETDTAPRSPVPARGTSGGLGQLFSRSSESKQESEPQIPVHESAPRVLAAPPRPVPRPMRARAPELPPLRPRVPSVPPVPSAMPPEEAPASATTTTARPPADSASFESVETQVETRSSGPRNLIAPEERRYDPDELTSIQTKTSQVPVIPPSDELPTLANDEESLELPAAPPIRLDEDDGEEEEQTILRGPSQPPVSPRSTPPPLPPEAPRAPAESAPPPSSLEPEPPIEWEDERPAPAWLADGVRTALAARAEWMEAEARALADPTRRARALTTASEILALVGEREWAERLAIEARDVAPTVALAHRQARGLAPASRDGVALVEALDAEMRHSPTPEARLHSALIAGDALRLAGDHEGAQRRYEQALRISTSDVRAPLVRVALALASGDTASPALKLPDEPELAPLSLGVSAALRLRGVDGKGPAATANEWLGRARDALDAGDAGTAASAFAELAELPEFARGARWIAAAIAGSRPERRPDAARWFAKLAEGGDAPARRALAGCALEGGDGAAVDTALAAEGAFSPSERAALGALLGREVPDWAIETLAGSPATAPLGGALAAMAPLPPPSDPGPRGLAVRARAERVAGSDGSRALVRLARLLSSDARPGEIETALQEVGESPPAGVRAVALTVALRNGRYGELAEALLTWTHAPGDHEAERDRKLAAALVAERASERERALTAYRAARKADPASEAPLRAILALDDSTDMPVELNALADELRDVRSAVARLEAVARADTLEDATRGDLLEKAHHAAPGLPIASFLAERIGRRTGDVDEVLRWVRERRGMVNDPLEAALDAVREALLIADREPALAAERLEEAHRARPTDVALRELYERMANLSAPDRAAWREKRAETAVGAAKALFLLEASYEYERAGDQEGTLRSVAAAAEAGGEGLAKIARERAELASADVARLADELLTRAKSEQEPTLQREAFERLAVVDEIGRGDPASALLSHRTILETAPLSKPSLRYVEHTLIGASRDFEIEGVAAAIAKALRQVDPAEAEGGGGECASHAELATRLRLRGLTGDWEGTREMVELAAGLPDPPLWALRFLQAHARARGDDRAILEATNLLIERMNRPAEAAALLVRAGEASSRLGEIDQACDLLERAAMEDPGDVVTWGLLADARQRRGDARGAAEACEALARTSVVPEHQLLAWYDAGRIWLDDVKEPDRAVIALEQAAALDVGFQDTFQRLSELYVARHAQIELAGLLERRLSKVTDSGERHGMEVERGRVLLEVGDHAGARKAFEAALADHPDDVAALGLFAELCAKERDWTEAEQAWVRLARLLPNPAEQRTVYERLGDLYAVHLLNLSRAEVAYSEVLKRAPDDVGTMERLVDVYTRQNDAVHAVELQQQLVTRASTPEQKRSRIVELANIYDTVGHEARKAEQTLESARRESPQDVQLLRALVDFYGRHKQMPAISILLDRAAADARRAVASGKLGPVPFETMEAVFDLRGRKDAARVAAATYAALAGHPKSSPPAGADSRALDPRVDDLLAPDILTPALRTLLARTGDALDAAAPYGVRDLTKLPPRHDLAETTIHRLAASMGLPAVTTYVSPQLGRVCLPVGSSPPTLVVGQALLQLDAYPARTFLVARALKLVQARASAFVRVAPAELAVLVGAWLQVFNPSWKPQGVSAAALADMGRRVQGALPRGLGPEVGVVALEVAASLGTQTPSLAASSLAWAGRAALLAVGDPSSALDAIAMSVGAPDGVPEEPAARASWILRTPEAKDLLAFSISDAYADARARLGLDR